MALAGASAPRGVTATSRRPRCSPSPAPWRLRPRLGPVAATEEGPEAPKPEDLVWAQLAFPFYMQSSSQHTPQVCSDFEAAVAEAEASADGAAAAARGASVWAAIRAEASTDAAQEPLLSSFLYASILAHDSFERALAFVLSNRLASAVMLPTQLFEIFHEVLTSEPEVREGALADVEACRDRDPACCSYSQALLYYKGYHALQTHRIAHALWCRGQRVMAVALQSRVSEVLAVDIHPAARLGRGILLDHGTGVVIGETAVIGNNVSLLQNVTLGGTGKEVGDRHPKISDNVLIGASATVLGNITVGRGAQIAAGSLVLKPVPPHTMVAGSPAKPVGKLFGNPALDMQQWSRKFSDADALGAADCSNSSSNGASSSSSSSSSNNSGTSSGNGASSERALAGAAAAASTGGSGSSSSSNADATRPAWAGAATNGHDPYKNGAGAQPKTPVTLASHADPGGEGAEGPAPLRGVYDGDVDATMDEEAAAALWGASASDPEWVI